MSETNQDKDPLIGTTFAGRYRIDRRLGAGGMGCVYVARQLSMQRDVALKVLHAETDGSESATQRFVREMQASSKVEHANTIRVYDFGRSDDGRLFLAMELIDGRSLQQVLVKNGALAPSRAIHIGTQVARALGAAHEEGIVHRDLKPENVMLMDRYGERDIAKVLDFGIAHFAEEATLDDTPQLTKTGTLIGTPLYMSPEQALGQTVDPRSDIYALGVLLYHMVTGSPPLNDPSPVRLLYMHAHEVPNSPNELMGGSLPSALDALIMKMLAKAPSDRPQTAAAVVRELRQCTENDTLNDEISAASTLDGVLTPVPESSQIEAAETFIAETDPSLVDGATATFSLSDTLSNSDTLSSSDNLSSSDTIDAPDGSAIEAQPQKSSRLEESVSASLDTDATPESAASADFSAPSSVDPHKTAVPQVQGPMEAHALPKTEVSVRGHGRRSVLIGLASLAIVGGGMWWLGGAGVETRSGEGVDANKRIAPTKKAKKAKKAEKETPAPDPRLLALRTTLDSLAKADGDPLTPIQCRTKDIDLLQRLVEAAKLLAGGSPRSRRAADKKAMTQLDALESAHKGEVEFDLLLAKARLYGGASDPDIVAPAQRAIDRCPEHALAYGLIGRVHLLGDRREVAARYYTQALRHDPRFARAHYNIGLAALGRHDPKAAQIHFDEALRLRPEDNGALLARGQARLLAGDIKGALLDLNRLVKRQPDDKLGWFLLGGAREQAHQVEAANSAWCEAAKLGHQGASKLCRP